MLRKTIHYLYGGGIGILLITLVFIFSHYLKSPPEPVKIYKNTVPATQYPQKEKTETAPEVPPQSEYETSDEADIEEPQITKTQEKQEYVELKPGDVDELLLQLPIQQTDELPPADPGVIVLREVFPEFDRIKREIQELMANIEDMEAPVAPDHLNPRWYTLETELQEYCQQIDENFPGSVRFFNFQGEEWAYDIDFRMLQDSLDGAVPSELDLYFRYASMREMLGLPEISHEQLQQIQ